MSVPENQQAPERARVIANEKIKLQASYANGIAIALLAVGTISPAVSVRPADLGGLLVQLAIGAVCLVGSAA